MNCMKKILIPVLLASAMLLPGPIIRMAHADMAAPSKFMGCKKAMAFDAFLDKSKKDGDAAAFEVISSKLASGDCKYFQKSQMVHLEDWATGSGMSCWSLKAGKTCFWALDTDFETE